MILFLYRFFHSELALSCCYYWLTYWYKVRNWVLWVSSRFNLFLPHN